MLEIRPKGTNALFLSVNEDRNITFEKLTRAESLAKILRSPARRVREIAWEGKKFFNGRRRVIAAADSSLATTIPVPIMLSREHTNAKNKITLAELENLIAQEMAKIFNGCRSEAAKRLRVSELDAVLVGAKAKHFTVDGKAIPHSPVGMGGKKISLLLEFVFTTRAVFEDLKPFFNTPEGFFFAEAPQAHLSALSRVRKLPLNLIMADDEGASLYVLEKPKGEHAVLYRERLGWRFSSFAEEIAKALAVSEHTAQQLYCLYHHGKMSAAAERAFKKTVEPALAAFFKELEKAKVKGTVYVDLPHALPFALPHKHGAAVLEEHPAQEMLAEFGFTADLSRFGEGKNAVLRPLLYFIEAYFDKSNSEINQKLRRRLHWLAG